MRRNQILAIVAGLSLIAAAAAIFDFATDGRWIEAGAVTVCALLIAVCIAIRHIMRR